MNESASFRCFAFLLLPAAVATTTAVVVACCCLLLFSNNNLMETYVWMKNKSKTNAGVFLFVLSLSFVVGVFWFVGCVVAATRLLHQSRRNRHV